VCHDVVLATQQDHRPEHPPSVVEGSDTQATHSSRWPDAGERPTRSAA